MQDVVLLGASNLVLGWPTIMNSLQRLTPAPLRVNVALGMGRSYIKTSAFWFRQLPAIHDCELWNHLPQSAADPPLVLITDLGNDIVYLFEPEQIAESVRACIRKVQNWRPDARIVMTGLPLASLMRVGKLRFVVARTILFPGCTLSRASIIEKSQALEQLAKKIAVDLGVTFVEPAPHWYGMDPIHVLPQHRATAFSTYFSAFALPSLDAANPPQQLNRIQLPTAAERIFFGRKKSVAQPVFCSPKSTISAW